MMMHIDLGTVLRGSVCDLYSNLVTRPTGAAVRSAIERQVQEIGAPIVTTIDFSQVQLLDFSCADEIVAKLLLRYSDVDGPRGYLTVRGLSDSHLDPIESVLERHGLALVSWHQGEAELFGHVDDDERTHWEVVRDHGPVTTATVASILSMDEDRTGAQLTRLAGRRLIMPRDGGYTVPGSVRGTT
jgi:hypothetical protein